ncbi:MAG: amidohydrolase family protein [Emergencia sp.]
MILRNARLISFLTEDYDLKQGDVIIENGRIDAVRPCGEEGGDCREYDLRGKTLLPAFIDLHVHLYFSSSDFCRLAQECTDQNKVMLNSFRYAGDLLKRGFTTVRDCGNLGGCGTAVREGIRQGLMEGPRIFSAGRCISPTAAGNSTFPGLYLEADSEEEIVKACRREAAGGSDFLKYMATGSAANEGGNPGMLITTVKELTAFRDAAESAGLPSAVHCHGKEGILLCAEAGVTTIEHASCIDEECIESILRRGGKTAVVPTLSPAAMVSGISRDHDIKRRMKAIEYGENEDYMVQAERAGILTGWGTDISLEYFQQNPGCEFLLRKERGFTNQEILKQATISSARILGVDNMLGTVKAGKSADFTVFEGKPEEDIHVLADGPHAVIKEGRIVYERKQGTDNS